MVALALVVSTAGAAAWRAAPTSAAPPPSAASPLDEAITAAYRNGYSLDQDAAEAAARHAVALAPDDPRAHRALAATLWVDILFRRGAVSVESYLSGAAKDQLSLPKPPPDLDADFKQEVARAIDLSQAQLKRNEKDIPARYELGAAYALQASYAASIEGSTTSAFLSAKHAYDAHEAVLAADPHRLDAQATVGLYRYLVSSLDFPARMLAYVVGFGGGKEKGIAMLEAAARDPAIHVEATTALVLIYSREGRHLDAQRLLHDLSVEYPRNRLFVLEEASADIRAGHNQDADAILGRGIEALDRDDRRKIPGERAVWLYKRGTARMRLNRLEEAHADLDAALQARPLDWIRGRIELYLGEVADLSGRRPDAVAAYQQAARISRAADDPICVAEASRWIKKPLGRP